MVINDNLWIFLSRIAKGFFMFTKRFLEVSYLQKLVLGLVQMCFSKIAS